MNPDYSGLAAEAQRLTKALAGWAEGRREQQSHHVGDWGAPHAGGQAPDTCQVCPVCQLIAMARGQRPEVMQKLVEAGTAAVSALAGLLESQAGPAAAPEDQHEDEPVPAVKVQRINVS